MEHALSSARDVLYNYGEVSRRLPVMLQSTELNIDSLKKQNSFLVQHAAKIVPMPLHCLHMQLTTDYYFRDGVIKEYFRGAALKEEEDKAKCENQSLYHYAMFSDNNEYRKLWKLGTLPPGLITFYNLTCTLNLNWHVLGLGYDPAVDLAEIENAAVVHYNGNYKPWLDLGISKNKPYWSKYVDLDNSHIQRCYMSEQ
uniref:Hexosyltransferase n=1 Tax=Leersia perrieri TaxID=77586 RepID=A0A0D9XIX3_9ORYZ